jgi:CheY-like chemotaxis protein
MSEAGRKEVFLVEDSAADVYLIRETVAGCSKDIRVWLVDDGVAALAFLRKDPPFEHVPSPALILLDLNLPKLGGIEVLRALRLMPAYKDTPVVIFSTAERDFAEERCLQAGATAYVQKPSNLEDFFAAIRALVCKWLIPDGSY